MVANGDVKVRLEALGREESYEVLLPGFDTGVTCRIGTSSKADIVLPRAAYPRLGGIHVELTFLDSGNHLDVRQRAAYCELDGNPVQNATIAFGRHELRLGDDRFQLSLERV